MIEINNLNTEEIFKLGYQNQKNKNFKEAIKLYNKVIKIDQSAVLAYYNLGLIYEQTSNTELAKHNYKEAIKLKPLFIYAYNNLGILFQREGNKAKAVENFKKVIKIDPKFISSWNTNYKSWKVQKKVPIKIIRYEDLSNQTFVVFKDIVNFINKITKNDEKINIHKLKNSVNQLSLIK